MYDMEYGSDTTTNNNKVKKRVRASQACVQCRKKKIKCDEHRPFCTQCLEAKVLCEYTEPKKRGPRKGYVQILEERLAQMERRLMSGDYHPSRSSSSTSENEAIPSNAAPAPPPPLQHSPLQYHDTDHTVDLPPIDIVNQLVDLFFKYINSIFPLVHRSTLKKSIQDGSVSRPLLYSVMAIGARFSENPSIRTDPPYLAGERFAEKALSLVDANTLQPNIENIQFWGIMSFLEYGRASGSKSWIYGGLAIRFCQELEFHKEETLSAPILASDGSIDTVAMALRRRVYWSCLSIDKLSSAGTHRPQCIERSDCDANMPNIPESLVLRDPLFQRNSEGTPITEDSLMNIAKYYLKILESYGEVNRYMYRAKSNSASIVWPPIPEFRNLDTELRTWQDTLPGPFVFNEKNLHHHRQHASSNYLNIWLCAHAVWCSSMMILHRGSLAFSDIKPTDSIAEDLYRRIQSSIETCRACVDTAINVYIAIKDYCGYNTLPCIGYSAYVLSTILMTSVFSNTSESCKRSYQCLQTLFELIDGLRPYWPMCERLSNATRELLSAHQKLYPTFSYKKPSSNFTLSPITQQNVPMNTLLGTEPPMMYDYNNNKRGNDIDFNSLEFLYDTGLFGQVVFDVPPTNPYSQQSFMSMPPPYQPSSSTPYGL